MLPLHGIFYSHVWAIHMLKHAGIQNFERHIIVELAANSNLAPVFGMQGKPRYGLGGLLHLAGKLDQLTQTFKNVPAPLVLAPQPELSTAALCSATALLAAHQGDYDQALVLIHVNEAADFADAYPLFSRFSILWDIADSPNQALVRLAETLVDNQCIGADTWGGMCLYKHPNRPLADANERYAALNNVLKEYPGLLPAAK